MSDQHHSKDSKTTKVMSPNSHTNPHFWQACKMTWKIDPHPPNLIIHLTAQSYFPVNVLPWFSAVWKLGAAGREWNCQTYLKGMTAVYLYTCLCALKDNLHVISTNLEPFGLFKVSTSNKFSTYWKGWSQVMLFIDRWLHLDDSHTIAHNCRLETSPQAARSLCNSINNIPLTYLIYMLKFMWWCTVTAGDDWCSEAFSI